MVEDPMVPEIALVLVPLHLNLWHPHLTLCSRCERHEEVTKQFRCLCKWPWPTGHVWLQQPLSLVPPGLRSQGLPSKHGPCGGFLEAVVTVTISVCSQQVGGLRAVPLCLRGDLPWGCLSGPREQDSCTKHHSFGVLPSAPVFPPSCQNHHMQLSVGVVLPPSHQPSPYVFLCT